MKNPVVHLFHGFLGNSHDWIEIQKFLDVEVIAYDLLSDLESFSGNSNIFTDWVDLQASRFKENQSNIVVGYSLGGRQLYHLPSDSFDAALVLAAHPGLEQGREERLEQDNLKSQSLSEQNWADWLHEWNAQEVFQNDRNRPDRLGMEDKRDEWAKVLREFSLGRQESRDHWLRINRHKVYWACGDSDSKFQGLKSRMVNLLAEDHVFDIFESGHGVIFDQPKQVAQLIERVVANVR